MLNFFISVIRMTTIQIISVFGIFFVLGFLLAEIQRATLKNYIRSVGWRGILWTAWLGTPVHEYGHAFFALLFGHKIQDIALFSPNINTGELGRVKHSYNPRNFYQNAGNFFIGLAPLIFGPLLLVFLLYILLPQGKEIFQQLAGIQLAWASIFWGIKSFLITLFSVKNLGSWYFWLFLYISFAIASHLAPSKPDLHTARHGGLIIIIALFLLNIFALLVHWDLTTWFINFAHLFTALITVYIYVLLISLVHLILSFILLWPWRRKRI